MEITFEDLYKAYESCLKKKKNKIGTYTFTNDNLCKNLYELLEELNNRIYRLSPSNCYGITTPAPREIYAAQFRDRIVQHFYMNEINDALEETLIDTCCSCRKGKGVDYALKELKRMAMEVSENGTKNCYFLKIDLSGYFMSIDRQYICDKFLELIETKYTGKYKDILLWLTPIIFLHNPAKDCNKFINPKTYAKIPERRILKPDSPYGIAIGNLTAQAGSNLNLNDLDHFVIDELGIPDYVRYVDDAIIVFNSKQELFSVLNKIETLLTNKGAKLNKKKTRIDTAYHGIEFLGKVTYPYGYQKPTKEVIKRTMTNIKKLNPNDERFKESIASTIGMFKNYNCRKMIGEIEIALGQNDPNFA